MHNCTVYVFCGSLLNRKQWKLFVVSICSPFAVRHRGTTFRRDEHEWIIRFGTKLKCYFILDSTDLRRRHENSTKVHRRWNFLSSYIWCQSIKFLFLPPFDAISLIKVAIFSALRFFIERIAIGMFNGWMWCQGKKCPRVFYHSCAGSSVDMAKNSHCSHFVCVRVVQRVNLFSSPHSLLASCFC